MKKNCIQALSNMFCLNPVNAGLVEDYKDWPNTHIAEKNTSAL